MYVKIACTCMLKLPIHVCLKCLYMYVKIDYTCMLKLAIHVCYNWLYMYVKNKPDIV